jgi:2-isopropylmalate synthase
MNTVTLYDTTLRDGTQGEGIALSLLDKLQIAQKLDDFGIHYIEGGWPGSNPKDVGFFEEARKLSFTHAKLAAFGSTRRAGMAVEVDPQIVTLLEARTPVVTFVGKSWLLHVTDVLGVTAEENRCMIRDTAAYFKRHGREVLYDAEHFFDGFKDNRDHALSTLAAAKEGGADMLILCDTNGGSLPEEIAEITRTVIETLRMPVGIHTHNDAGLGVANAMAAIRAGARQVQGTMNGYGERVGNCNMTTLIPNLQLKMGVPVVPDLTKLRDLSLYVDELANVPHDRRAPYVGDTAFAHKGGLHVHAVQKIAHSYEHVSPRAVGNYQHILMSELAGQSNVLAKAEELGFHLQKGSPEVASILNEVKRLENLGYEFEAADASFELLVRRVLGLHKPIFQFHFYHCDFARMRGGNRETTEAVVKLSVDGAAEHVVAEGDGPVNALDQALRKALLAFYPAINDIKLLDYKVRIIDSKHGTGAKTRVLIVSTDGHKTWGTVGVSNNIIEASWQALTDSIEYYFQPAQR